MSQWGWTPERSQGIWRHGSVGLRPFLAAVPFLTILTILLQLHFASGTLTSADGVLFDLPDAEPTEAIDDSPVALMMPVARETLIFFDDTRYMMKDATSMQALEEQLTKSFAHGNAKSILVLADRRVASGDLMKFSSLAKKSGVRRILFAEKTRAPFDDEH